MRARGAPMIVGQKRSMMGLLRWQRDNAILYTVGGVVAVLAYELLEVRLQWLDVALPTLPLAVIGGALGIFVSFRTSSSYDRWWEGRKLWGRVVNASRHLCDQVLAYLPADREPDRRELVMRQVTWVHALRVLLRGQDLRADRDLVRLVPEAELAELATEPNPTHALLARQHARFAELARGGVIDGFVLQSLDDTLEELLGVQGGCERIKKTPVPPSYGFVAQSLIRYFSFLLPLAIVGDLHLLAIPVNLLVCLAFTLIAESGRVLEDPFTMFWNGLPLHALSATIEQNLRHRLGDRDDVPPVPRPDGNGILM